MTKKKKKEVQKISKVVYYDEKAAMDYVTIMNNGNITTKEINEVIDAGDASASITAEMGIKGSLLRILGLSAGVNSKLSGCKTSEKIINSTITTNIMTEFIKIASDDDNIEKLYDLKLDIDPNTLTYLKSINAYITLLKDPDKLDEFNNININKIDEVILSTKGYFEFIASRKNEDIAILRFNIDSLRNNYKFNDLIKMDLCYYGIKVGNVTKEAIRIENEIKQTNFVYVPEDLNDCVGEDEDKDKDNVKELPMYDIVIAGVSNGKK